MIHTAQTPRFASLGTRALAVALVIALASPLVLLGAPSAHGAAPVLATGTVGNSVTSAGIGNAWVRAFFYDPVDNDWKYAAATYTASNGSYSISTGYYGAGTYEIRVDAAGYISKTQQITWSGAAQTANFSLTPLGPDAYEPDDTSASAKPIPTNGTAQERTIHVAGNVDWVVFSATEGKQYTIETSPTGTSLETDTYLTLYASDATTVLAENDDFAGKSSRIRWIALTTGTLYVRVRHADMAAGIGAYRLGVTESTPRVIATGTVEETATHTPIAGASVLAERYNTTTREWERSAVATTSASGAYVIYDELELGSGPYRFTATANGYFGARSAQMGWNGSTPLSVPFVLSPLVVDSYEPDGSLAQAKSITPDGPAQNHTLYPAADQDWCTFSVVPGTTYTIATAPSPYGETDTYLTLYASDGTTVLAQNDNADGRFASVTWAATSNVTVYAVVRHANASAGIGAYALSVTTRPTAPTIASGSVTATGTSTPIAGATVRAYLVDPVTSEWRLTDTTTSGADGSFTVRDTQAYGAGEYRIQASASGYISTVETIEWTGAPLTGIALRLSPLAPDAYEPDGSATTAKPITVDGPAQPRTIAPSGDRDWAVFSAVAGTTYAVRTAPSSPDALDTRLELYDSDGVSLLAANDDFGGPFSRLVWTADVSRNVYVVADAKGGAMGAYQLMVEMINRAPVAADDAYTTTEGVALTVPAPGVLANDTDADGDALSAAKVTDPAHGAVTLTPNGSFTYTPAAGFAGTDTFTYRANDGTTSSGTATVTITVNARPPVTTTAFAGTDRYATAILASRAAYADGSCGSVIVATGANYPDALSAAGLGGAARCPVLLVAGDRARADVVAEIKRLTRGRSSFTLYVMGGTAAVSAKMESSLRAQLSGETVVRFAGRDRYETARLVAARVRALAGAAPKALLVTGAEFTDGLIVGPAAYAAKAPILLSRSSYDAELVKTLKALQVRTLVLCGTTARIPASVEGALRAAVPGLAVVRAADEADAYARAAEAAAYFTAPANGFGLSWAGAGIATGERFPDGLAAGCVEGAKRTPLMLTRTFSLPAPTAAALAANKATIAQVRYYGGDAAVSPAVRTAVEAALK